MICKSQLATCNLQLSDGSIVVGVRQRIVKKSFFI